MKIMDKDIMIKDILNTIINELDVESQFKFVKLDKMMYNLLRNKCITYKKSAQMIERCYIKNSHKERSKRLFNRLLYENIQRVRYNMRNIRFTN
jgi:hypothetical protein